MRNARYRIFSAAMVAAACLGCQRQYVYSLNVGSSFVPIPPSPPGPVTEHEWTVSIETYQQGFYQYSQWENSRGTPMYPMANGKPSGAIRRTHTTVYLGVWFFTVRAPAWPIAAAGLALLSIAAWLVTSATGSIWRHLRPNDEPP